MTANRGASTEIELDAFVIMPNHMHGILVIIGDPSIDDEPPATRATEPVAPTATKRPPRLKSQSIGAIVGQFKSVATKRINAVRGTPGTSVWQRNYYEHIISSDRSLDRLRDYIDGNPALWDRDSLYMPDLGRQ